MKYSFLLLLMAFIFPDVLISQNSGFISIHQQDCEYYGQFSAQTNAEWAGIRGAYKPNGRNTNKACTLNKIVFGWHPYWSNGLEANYDWSLLSDLSYFSYEVDPATGNATSTHSWSTANVVTQALANGVRVNLCVTLFSSHATFFGNSTSQQTLITNLINLVQSRGANGVNIDFEGVPSSQKTQFTAFLVNLCNQMHTAIPGSQVSIALYSVDWSNVFDIPTLNNYIDLFIIMGYDYYYGGSTTAGPTSGLYSLTSSYNYNCSKSVNYYLYSGVSPSKLVLGLPYYGEEWATSAGTVPSSATSAGSSKIYKTVRANASGFYTSANKHFNMDSYVPYFAYTNGSWYQCWIDDAFSLGKKFELVQKRGIAGIGIWALGYDDGYPELWDKINEKLTTCRADACTDTIYDMGGPSWNYYDKEDYSYTISPSGASSVSLNFQSFDLEAGYDSLWLYDGNSTNSPLIGGYSGTLSPGTVNTTGPSLTLRFHSDNLTTHLGYTAIWQCINDIISPTTLITVPAPWITQNFTANFTDADNINGTGIEKSFYNVSDFDGTTWNANKDNGFFRDDFDILQPQWTQATGTWNISPGNLDFTDETQGNSNIYAPLNQTLSNRYLYHFNAKVGGAGTNRRFGFHFFSDNAALTNRGNSYFVWFRIDNQSLQFYKVINDTFYLENTTNNVITNINQNYDFKISYDRINGTIAVWRDNIFLGSWTDPAPYSSNGNYISFRTGNCTISVDNICVYRSRFPSANITIGNSSADIRYQNPNPSTPSAQIRSIVVDGNHNLSSIATNNLNIDWTPPASLSWINDGTSSDMDTTYSNTQLSGNWSVSTDPNSGIASYGFSFGISPGDSSISGNWINNFLNTSVVQNSLSLNYNTLYFINAKAMNNAGLSSTVASSDGVLVLQAGTPPTALFQASDSVICSGQAVSFNNQTVQGGTYNWTLNGATPSLSALSNPTVTYNSPGIYDVVLIATNTDGSDTLVKTGYIVVNESPVSAFTVNTNSGQVPLPVTFTNQSTGATQFLWNFGDGNSSADQNPFNIYNTQGTYIVSLVSSNLNCPADTSVDTIYVGINNVAVMNTEVFRIYPNPVSSELFIENKQHDLPDFSVELFTLDGKKLDIQYKKVSPGILKINTGNFKSGKYVLKISSDDTNYFSKVEIIH